MESILELSSISKSYAGQKVLQDVSLSVAPGKIVGLLGSNGSGKTTLMKIAAGLITADSGEAKIAGNTINRKTRAVTAFMPDKPLTEGWMRVEDAIHFYKDFYADFDHVKADEMLVFMKLNKRDRVSTLSKGMNERLQLALTLSRNAMLYLLDEPIGGVDPVARAKILDAIVNYYSEESSIVISTHLVTDIERIFDEVIFIRNGQIVLQDHVENIRVSHGKSVDEMFKGVFAE